MSDELLILNSPNDFIWYKKNLDVSRKYNHEHNYSPDKYPCKIESERLDDFNGPYYYDHSFIYQQEVECECCNNISIIWPNQGE